MKREHKHTHIYALVPLVCSGINNNLYACVVRLGRKEPARKAEGSLCNAKDARLARSDVSRTTLFPVYSDGSAIYHKTVTLSRYTGKLSLEIVIWFLC